MNVLMYGYICVCIDSYFIRINVILLRVLKILVIIFYRVLSNLHILLCQHLKKDMTLQTHLDLNVLLQNSVLVHESTYGLYSLTNELTLWS
jgi:hypothetical protein